MDFDVFITHKTVDDSLATELALGLERQGLRAYVDHREDTCNEWIELALLAQAAPALILLLTEHSYNDQADNVFNEALPSEGSTRMVIVVNTPGVPFGKGAVGVQFKKKSWIEWDPNNGVDSVVQRIRKRLMSRQDGRPDPRDGRPAVYTVLSRVPLICVSLVREDPEYDSLEATVATEFGNPDDEGCWRLTPQQFEQFLRIAGDDQAPEEPGEE